jgi:hypothetical protein
MMATPFDFRWLFFTIISVVFFLPELHAQENVPAPGSVKEIDISGYRRVTGSPEATMYFLMSKGGFEARNFASGKSYERRLNRSVKLQTSDRGNFFAIIDYSSFRPTYLRVTGITVFDADGNQMWSRDGPECNAFILSDASAALVGIDGAEGLEQSRLVFFDEQGNIQSDTEVSHLNNSRFCENGDYFFAISSGTGLLKFESRGQQIARYPDCKNYRCSADGRMVATQSDSLLQIYRDDKLLLTLPSDPRRFRDLRFSSDGTQVALLQSEQLRLIDILAGTSLWSYEPADDDHVLVGFDANDDLSLFICSSNNGAARPEIRNTQGKVVLLDQGGGLIWQHDLSYSTRSVRHPEVKLSADNRLISILTKERLELFKYW